MFIFGYTRTPTTNLGNPWSISKICFGISIFTSNMWSLLEKTGTDKSRRFVESILKNIRYGINIYRKASNGHLVNLWKLLKPRKQDARTRQPRNQKIWNQETKKPRNTTCPSVYRNSTKCSWGFRKMHNAWHYMSWQCLSMRWAESWTDKVFRYIKSINKPIKSTNK